MFPISRNEQFLQYKKLRVQLAVIKKSTARGALRRKAQFVTRERKLAQLKISDEEEHDSDERTGTIYYILYK